MTTKKFVHKHALSHCPPDCAYALSSHAFSARAITCAVALLLLQPTLPAAAQSFETVIPMESWVEFMVIEYTGAPVPIHLRTGYERPIMFPEPVKLHSVNGQLINSEQSTESLPGQVTGVIDAMAHCPIEIDNEVAGFSPQRRFNNQSVIFQGAQTGTLYSLVVKSSPTGSRQPVELKR